MSRDHPDPLPTEKQETELLLAQMNAVLADDGLKVELVENPGSDHTQFLRPWRLNEKTGLYKKTDLNLPIVIKLPESSHIGGSLC